MSTDHFYLERHEIKSLMDQLRAVPWLVRELDIVITRQTSYNPAGSVGSRGGNDDTGPLVFHDKASDHATQLLGTLRAWTEHTCTVRGLPWPGEGRAAHYANWLDKHVIDLACTEQAPDAATDIIDTCRRVYLIIDRPEERSYIGPCQSTTPTATCRGVFATDLRQPFTCTTCRVTIDTPTLHAATEDKKQRAARLTLGTAKELHRTIKDIYGLDINEKRIYYLETRGVLSPRPSPLSSKIYQLGEVIDAHTRLARHRKPA